MKRIRTGLLCLSVLTIWMAPAQAQEPPPAQAQEPPPAQAQTTPAQTPPAQTAPAQPPGTPQVVQQQPPAPAPKLPDIRMPGESGWDVGVLGWFPKQAPSVDKGKAADFLNPSHVKFPGKPKYATGADIGIAAGRHNQLRIYYYEARAAGNFIAPQDITVWTQTYSKGDLVSASYRWQNIKVSYEYLTWPFPVETRKFRLKTLWQVQYVTARNIFDAPLKPTTDSAGNPLADSSGNPLTYRTQGSHNILYPTFGLGMQEYVTRNVRLEMNASGFAWPHKSVIWDGDASANFRARHIELRVGVKAFHFKTSPQAEFFIKGTQVAPFVGLRWYSD